MAVQVTTSSSSWLDSSDVWLFRLEKDVFRVRMRDCPSINVLVRVAHITPVNKVVRHRVLMACEQLDSSLASTFPALLLINNACNFKFDKDEVQGLFNIGTESWAVLIWSYKCIPGAKYIGRPPDHFNVIDLPWMPVLDLQSSACACTGNPQNTRIRNFTNLTYVESNSEDDGEANDAGDELYTTTFPIKGSTYNDIYQENLKTVQSALRLKKPMTIQLEKEPDNPKDSNAILVKVCVDDLFLIIGYIGVKKLPKVVSAIRLQEIVDIKVKSVTTWLVRNLNIRKLRCYIQMCKKNK